MISALRLIGIAEGAQLAGPPCPKLGLLNGTLMRGTGPEVWVIHNGERRHVMSPAVFSGCGYKWGDVNLLADSTVNSFPRGPNVTGGPCP